MNSEELKKFDPEIFDAVTREIERERNSIVLIASENYASRSVLQAQGSIFTNKYAEGYPGKRYYGGCEYADIVENLAIERAKKLFGAEHVNVQPHSGTQANMAVFFSFFSGIFYKTFFYGVDKKSGLIDYEDVRKCAKKHKPKMILAGASSYSRIIDFRILSDIAKEINAYLLADIAHIAGLVTTGLHPSPVPYADFVTTTTHKTLKGPRGGMILCKAEYAKAIDRMVFPGIQGGPLVHVITAKAVALKEALSKQFEEYQIQVIKNAKELADALMNKGFKLISGGTDIHLMLLDLTNKKITGKEAERILDLAGITVNKNSIPYDKRPPAITSGIRIGTPIVTTRKMKEPEMVIISDLLFRVIDDPNNSTEIKRVSGRVRELCKKFPVYEE
jgi:glycine hydroxymethyltransferase